MIRFWHLTLFWLWTSVAATPLAAAPVEKTNAVPADAALPPWPAMATPASDQTPLTVRSGELEILQGKAPLASFLVRVGKQNVALGSAPLLIGYVKAGEMRWLNCTTVELQHQQVQSQRNGILSLYEAKDPDGATWRVERHFQPGRLPGTVEIQTDVGVNQDRSVAFLPLLMLFPGAGSFGQTKGQGLFAGLEYLDDEPSSSEADVIGPAARRQVPDNLKITFPLMAIENQGRYVALSWQMRPFFSAVFDSPDRLFKSGGHVMGLIFPGSDGQNRQEGNLLPRVTELLHGGQIVTSRVTIFGGLGESVVPAVEQFCKLRPLPAVPGTADLPSYIAQAAGGWLDSKIREGKLIRHALAGDHFKPQPAADAALWMEWLAVHDTDSSRAERLLQTATSVLSAVPADGVNSSGVGHVRYPVEALVFGHVAENVEHAQQIARSLLGTFDSDGSVKYHPQPGGQDYAKTYFTNEASGLASRAVVDLLEAAAFSGNRELLDTGLQHLRSLDRFHHGVPRGAQTWECPLHTPDILASAQMVHAYTLGFELTGEPHFLQEAHYWAWTGVPFTYLVSPTDHLVGLYATIPVFGATNWRAPVWLGLPVQWCGLVYADALYRLARQDPKGPWKKLADGITASGIQQSWPETDPDFKGLLPDSFVLRQQKRNGPAINPATVEACAVQYLAGSPVYQFACFRQNHLLVHAPGEITDAKESKNQLGFQVKSWVRHPYFVLINGFTRKPQLQLDGRPVALSAPQEFLEKQKSLILRIEGQPRIELEL